MDGFELKRITPDVPPQVFDGISEIDRICINNGFWSAQDFHEEVCKSGGIVFAVYCGDEIVGVIAGFTASDTGEILTLATKPEYRRQGIGKMLLSGFFSAIPEDVVNIALEVRHSNQAAIALYESFGFARAGVRKRFYREPTEDADVMVRELAHN